MKRAVMPARRCRPTRMSNIERRISNFDLPCSIFDIPSRSSSAARCRQASAMSLPATSCAWEPTARSVSKAHEDVAGWWKTSASPTLWSKMSKSLSPLRLFIPRPIPSPSRSELRFSAISLSAISRSRIRPVWRKSSACLKCRFRGWAFAML